MVDDNDDTLAHYGVEGMRWGVRKKYVAQEGKTLSRRKQIHNAIVTKDRSKNWRRDDRSQKTINLGKASTALSLTALGTAVAGVLSPEPISKGVLFATTILTTAGSVTMSALEARSAGDDLLDKYGSKKP